MNDAYSEERSRIEESLHESRAELSEAVGELREAAREALSPGDLVARRPYLWIATAFAFGLLMGRRHPSDLA